MINRSNLGSNLERLLPKASRHNFEGDAAFSEVPSLALMNISHLRCGACRGSIYRTRNDGRHKCRPYKDLKRKFLYYQVIKLEVTPLCKLDLGNSLSILDNCSKPSKSHSNVLRQA